MGSEKPSIFVGWIHKGRKYFEVIPKSQYRGLLEKLMLDEKVHPGAIFISKMLMCNWIAPEYHKGYSSVFLSDFWDELNSLDDPNSYYKPTKYKVEQKSIDPYYGYISPDGRYFQCEYYGHSTLARKIVGELEKVNDPQEYLYEKGWLCIYHDPYKNGTYAIGMGLKKHMTDKQLKMLDALKIPHNSYNFDRYLLGDE